MNIQQSIEKTSDAIKIEINRLTERKNGSILKEAEKLKDFGISSKELKSGKKLVENTIPEIFLENSENQETANV